MTTHNKNGALTDVAARQNRDVTRKEAEEKLKHKNLNIEIQRMWNTKCLATGISKARPASPLCAARGVWAIS
jgi:hypothetical protein